MKLGFGAFWASWLICLPLYSQFSDDFSDGHLDAWQGDVAHFIINGNQQLQLNAPGGSTTSWIHTPLSFQDSMIWEMYFKMDFAPSTTNQLKIYLALSSSDLSSASGYFLEIGASGDVDPLELKYLDNGNSKSIAASAPGLVAFQPVELIIRMIKKSNGQWDCYKLGALVPELLFTTAHDVIPLSQLNTFGYQCRYTDTRRDKFFFDDISIQPILPDTTAPACLSLSVLDANTIELLFDEPLDDVSVQNPMHYLLSPGNLNPDIIEHDQHILVLRWDQSFISQLEYTLTLRELKDLSGNTLITDSKMFTYIHIDKAAPHELLITEIMADPTPVIGLPDAEYLEIYNTTSNVFKLSDYILQIGSSQRNFPDELIYGNEYIIVCHVDHAPNLSSYGRTVALGSMPALTNTGTSLLLKDRDDRIIHEINYSASWYGDPGKSDGGWSLEMIHPLHICSGADNWAAANNLLGGTPGTVNSQWSLIPDLVGPQFLSLFTSGPERIQLRFNEKLDVILMENPSAYSIQPGIGISDALLSNATTVELSLVTSLQPGIVYRLLPFVAYDCLGNPAALTDTIHFGLIAAPEPGDILINEILFNPATGGSRFIEIINVSDKFINLNTLALGRITVSQNNIYPTGVNEIISPGQLAVFSPSPSDILFRYTVPQPTKLYQATLPAWDDRLDHAAIIAGGIFIDSFTYSSSWHHPVISDQNGVSLERISVSSPTSSASTWHSAAAVSGYATPTGQNSQKVNLIPETQKPFNISNRQFSPNDDGFKDFLTLHFQLTSGDDIGSVWVYDLEGREIQQLLSNETLGTSAIVQWDGRTQEGRLADMGIYILFVRLWDTSGKVTEYQETCALVLR